jgi:hypothetical protein
MGFKMSDPKVYAQMNLKGHLREWMDKDIFKKLSKLAGSGWAWDSGTLTLSQPGPKTMAIDTPWSHATVSHDKNCNFDHHIVFDKYGIIPPKCLNCWKVCMGLPNFAALMEMEELQTQMPWPCKCGIELRDYTSKEYGAYFYNNTLEEGRDKFHTIVDIVKKHMTNGEEIAKGIILKRGCTEFEMIKGPSPYWHMSKEEEAMYELLMSHVVMPRNNAKQPEIMKNYVRQNWALWAHSHGDMTYQAWNNGESLFPDYVRYHEGDLEEIKKDIADCLASVTEPQAEPVELPKVEYPEEVVGEEDELT